jgi:peroxiredoxin
MVMKLYSMFRHSATLAVTALLLFASPAFAILQKGQPAPPLNLVTTSGQPVTLANYKGYVLVLDFFATWCAPCREAIPHMNSLTRKYGKQGLQILGMSVDDSGDKAAVKSFISERKVAYPVAITSEELQADYGLRSVPTLFIINKKGIVVEKYQGYSDEVAKSMETAIKRLLAE